MDARRRQLDGLPRWIPTSTGRVHSDPGAWSVLCVGAARTAGLQVHLGVHPASNTISGGFLGGRVKGVTKETLTREEAARAVDAAGISRYMWLAQAVAEKLERAQNGIA